MRQEVIGIVDRLSDEHGILFIGGATLLLAGRIISFINYNRALGDMREAYNFDDSVPAPYDPDNR